MNNRLALTAFALAAVVAAHAQSTFATFSNTGTVNFQRTQSTFTGSGTIASFVLGSQTYTNAGFVLSGLTVLGSPSATSGGILSNGAFTITSGTGASLLTASFASGELSSNGLWNTAFNASNVYGDSVVYGGSVKGDQSANGFSFALSPVVGVTNAYNASFSAVGNVQAVPEPTCFAALGLGAVALVRRRRA